MQKEVSDKEKEMNSTDAETTKMYQANDKL